jgi:hypothetical protein
MLTGGQKLHGLIETIDDQGFVLSQGNSLAKRIAYGAVDQIRLSACAACGQPAQPGSECDAGALARFGYSFPIAPCIPRYDPIGRTLGRWLLYRGGEFFRTESHRNLIAVEASKATLRRLVESSAGRRIWGKSVYLHVTNPGGC